MLAGAIALLPAPAFAWPPALLEANMDTQGPPPPFPTPEALQSAIPFWRDIFTKHTSDRVVLHDREQMEIIWRVVELPRAASGAVDEVRAREEVKRITEDLRARLQRLEIAPTALDDDDRILLSLCGNDPKRLEGAHTRVRGQKGVADYFRVGLQRYRQWGDSMRAVLTAQGVPEEIVVLPFVESMFNPTARSSVGAAGLWQLMPATAKGLGLTVQPGNDERLDVLKATKAAAKMLKQNHKMLGSWPLAITGYNHGPNGVRRAVQQVGSTDLMQLIEHYDKATWGFASKNFYAEFLAALAIMREIDAEEALARSQAAGSSSVRD